jgi:hypothetical protein
VDVEFRFSFPGAEWIRTKAIVRRAGASETGAEFIDVGKGERMMIAQGIYREAALGRRV